VACGVAVVVTHRRLVLFGKRRSDASGYEWQLPGGWIEAGESLQQAALREVLEETGLRLRPPRFIGITSNVFSKRKHSISLYFEAECCNAGSLTVREGDKCVAWQWRDWTETTDNLYLPLRLLKQTDYQPFLQDKHRTYVAI